jgi:hypothetical protein
MNEPYVCDDDVFNAAAVRNARAVDDKLRELAPEPWMTTVGHGPEKLPVRLFAA